ncbi:MAG: UDP-N-acetylglucosamine--N-acetylmuramyl-(pentapeptide) pyrophosphoryl-undecaprenol N-acetylglucosamine transferase [Roseovarius sp.]|nr:UDP-N-acetylglucosamine--N-acetylmuramyl-(pentapeptide) pyrophosphoryl-undecaprenol N-acetylglucosamine transferase [Roseovarius sp.]MCY4314767.1 UDP-N-acetylglucosamine--N-acetylmuramyl-(pentapeptide) pyrophosphoryl-undecaprenol N-acetylglucosamine transferase [Roseovarius sp.]
MGRRRFYALIAAGGTGGHVFSAQSLAEELLQRGWHVKMSMDARGARFASGFPECIDFEVISSATFARGGLLSRFAAPFRILAGVVSALAGMIAKRPDVVVGFGGYPTIPSLSGAWLLRIPSMIHEQNGVLGRVNRTFARRVDKVACGTWPLELPSGANGIHVGNPVRAEILQRAGDEYVKPGKSENRIVVIGGSQGARLLSDVVPEAIAELPENLRHHLKVSHQARDDDAGRVSRQYAAYGIAAEVETFFYDIAERLSKAQLVVSRAGAASVADICVIGRPSILIPFAAAAHDHQTTNAKPLVEAGGAIMISESELSPSALGAGMSSLLFDSSSAAEMAKVALSLGIRDAQVVLADLVEQMAGNPRRCKKTDPTGESE